MNALVIIYRNIVRFIIFVNLAITFIYALKLKQRIRLLIIQKCVRQKFKQYVVKIESLKCNLYIHKEMVRVMHHYRVLMTTKDINNRLKIFS